MATTRLLVACCLLLVGGTATGDESCDAPLSDRATEMVALAKAFRQKAEADVLEKYPGEMMYDKVGDVLQGLRLFDRALWYHNWVHEQDPNVLTAISVATDLKGLQRHEEAIELVKQIPEEVLSVKAVRLFAASLYDCISDTQRALSLVQGIAPADLATEDKLVTMEYITKILPTLGSDAKAQRGALKKQRQALKKSLLASDAVGKHQLVPNYLPSLRGRPVWDDWVEQFPHLEAVVEVLKENADELTQEFRDLQAADLLEPDDECLGSTWQRYEINPAWRQVDSCAENLAAKGCRVLEIIKGLKVPKFNVIRASYSTIGPNSHILPHYGMTNGQLKFHLGLIVPEGDCATIRVEDKYRHWTTGDVVMIDDSFDHEVWNNCSTLRTVFQLVIVHPDATALQTAELLYPNILDGTGLPKF